MLFFLELLTRSTTDTSTSHTRASRIFDEVVVAVYDKPLKSLLFMPEVRISLVRTAFEDYPKIKVMGYSGMTVEFCRNIGAQAIVRGLRVFSDFEYEFRMALANHRLAPEIELIALITAEEHTFLSSTTVREIASWAAISAAWSRRTSIWR